MQDVTRDRGGAVRPLRSGSFHALRERGYELCGYVPLREPLLTREPTSGFGSNVARICGNGRKSG